ncbi:hypothetical protein VP01_2436g1 [Puccinia sorghi]|uniref:No apical meristem-associated C-terminal domain-containing protein n=1 Tax=Puccinia sorghi TaxID=27349 RepID=A0A0L6V695_9BASI|nr:hypothetical protein VP01_2436g1 [Puccinia sorghi]
MTTWKQVKDYCDTSGNGDLLKALIDNMIGNNWSAQAKGDRKLHDPLDILMAVPGAVLSDTSEDTDWDCSHSPAVPKTGPKERALDDDADGKEDSSVPEGTNIIQPPASNSLGPPSAASPIAKSNPASNPVQGPQSAILALTRGAKEEVPKKEDPVATGMFMMMAKATKQAAKDHKIQELARQDKRHDAEVLREEAMEQAWLDCEMMDQRRVEPKIKLPNVRRTTKMSNKRLKKNIWRTPGNTRLLMQRKGSPAKCLMPGRPAMTGRPARIVVTKCTIVNLTYPIMCHWMTKY